MRPDWHESEFGWFVERLAPLIGRESDGLVLGAGVGFLGAPTPLVLANADYWDVRYEAWRPELLPIDAVGPLSGLLSDMKLPPEATVMFVDPPQPLGIGPRGEGTPIRGEMRGTLGPCLPAELCPDAQPLDGDVFMTAGHVVGDVESEVVEIVPRRLFPDSRRPLGKVSFRCTPEPFGSADYDIALVDAPAQAGKPCQVASTSVHQGVPLPTTIFGGISGRGYGEVIGALGPLSDAEGRLNWKNSWIMVPGELGAEGDSGGAVETVDGSVLGILVGGSKVKGEESFAALYVQDLEAAVIDLFM